MTMTHRQRLETAWRHEEPDRVPIEMAIAPQALSHPRAERLAELVAEHADNFLGLKGPDFGFMGMPTEYSEEIIEDRPGEYKRMRRTHRTPAGDFAAITYHPADSNDYHWEQRFITTVDDFRRVVEAPLSPAPWDRERYLREVAEVGERGIPTMTLPIPSGRLVRWATHEEVYAWFHTERELMHRFLEAGTAQVVATVDGMQGAPGAPLTFLTFAHEMLIPPWMGHALFDEYSAPYDREVSAAIRRKGGRWRAHCHGNCMDFLEEFADIGIDSVEPLEAPPYANCDLAEAKRRVGGRMLLSGNVMSQNFTRQSPAQTREEVRRAIAAAAPGGGYTLRTSGGSAGVEFHMPAEILDNVLANCEAYLLAGLEFGEYPIRTA